MYGSYRDTSYGLEVRSLGGFFTQDKYLDWVYDNTIKMLEYCSIQENIDRLNEIKSPDKSNIAEVYDFLGIDLNSITIK